MLKKFVVAVVAVVVMGWAGAANADTISVGAGCSVADCFGLTYTLTVNPTGGSSYQGTLQITGTYAGDNVARFISAVDFKVSNDVVPPLLLIDAPGGIAGWTVSENGINNAGCSNSGSGFVCAQDPVTISLASLLYSGSSYAPIDLTWKWTFNLPTGTALFANLEGAHIGAQFDTADGSLNGHIVSQEYHAVAVPEPASMLLLGAGTVGFATVLRRRRS